MKEIPMKYNFDEIIDRTNTNSLKWDKYSGTDIIPMWVADMDFKVPPAILNALRKTIDHGILGYSSVSDELYDTVISRLKSLYDWDVEKEWIKWIPGVVCGINMVCNAFGKPGENIVTTVPVYPPFLAAPENNARPLSMVPMLEQEGRMTFDFEGLEDEFKKGASIFILCSPYNPCGTVFTEEELTAVVDLCIKYDVLICSDEIHSDFVLDKDKKHIPTASLSREAALNTITLMAPSKTYNIPGLGCSFAIIPDSKRKKILTESVRDIVPDVNIMGLVAAKSAYEECDPWLEQLIDYLRTNRDIVMDRVNKMPGCRLNHIESTFLAWIDVRDTGIKDPAGFFEEAGVGLSDGKYFGQKGFVRLNFGCPLSVLEEGLKRMDSALGKIKQQLKKL